MGDDLKLDKTYLNTQRRKRTVCVLPLNTYFSLFQNVTIGSMSVDRNSSQGGQSQTYCEVGTESCGSFV